MSPYSGRLQIIDTLRGLAALMVAVFHFTADMPQTGLTAVSSCGWLGVQIFFVISGFIIPQALIQGRYHSPKDLPRYLWKRAARLHPPFLTSVLLTALLWHLSTLAPGFQGQAPNYTAVQMGLHIPLLNGICGFSWLQPVYWTLAIEFQYYLLMGFLLPLLQKGNSAFWIPIGMLLACSLLPRADPTSVVWIWPYLPLFVLGIITCFHFQQRISTSAFGLGWCASSLIGMLSMGWPETCTGALTALAIAGVRLRFPRPVLWMGSISYSLYLLHLPIGGRVINLTKRLGHASLTSQLSSVLVALTLSLLAAWIWFRWVETPSQRLSSSIRYRPDAKDLPQNRPDL